MTNSKTYKLHTSHPQSHLMPTNYTASRDEKGEWSIAFDGVELRIYRRTLRQCRDWFFKTVMGLEKGVAA